MDLDQQLEEQGPFDLILHKLTDQIAKGNQGNLRAKQHVEQFQVPGLFSSYYFDVYALFTRFLRNISSNETEHVTDCAIYQWTIKNYP